MIEMKGNEIRDCKKKEKIVYTVQFFILKGSLLFLQAVKKIDLSKVIHLIQKNLKVSFYFFL